MGSQTIGTRHPSIIFWQTWGVRVRITLLSTITVTIVVVVIALSVRGFQTRQMMDLIDKSIVARSFEIATLISDRAIEPVIGRQIEESFIQVLDEKMNVVASSPNLAGEAAVVVVSSTGVGPYVRSIEGAPIGENTAFRIAMTSVNTPSGLRHVVVGASMEPIAEGSRVLLAAFLFALPVLVLVVGSASWILLGRALDPVERIRRTVESIDGKIGARRVPVPLASDEVAKLATTMNMMLERVENYQVVQERFAHDASHELRTPLSTIRATLENIYASTATGPARRIQRALEDVHRMESLIESFLAEAIGNHLSTDAFKPVDLDDIVLDEATALTIRQDLVVDVSRVGGGQILGDASSMRRAIRNVMVNAANYAESKVTVGLHEQSGDVVLDIRDDGPGIPADFIDTAFDRFTRVDSDRRRTSGGFGLGLSISQQIINVHQGRIWIDPESTPGARIVITLPAIPRE